ncbi:MAG TPA: heme-binding domain-containing protein [Cyclobacteriaceae bacterium]|nr:heme-binding domain-containing protein [Cyclobacteriaceae bacterium]
MKKKILYALIGVLVVIQFLQSSKNIAEGISENDITKVYQMPENVVHTLQKKCYDCHSHNTEYPWYYNIQPLGWWMNFHIKEGKEELNFSDFKNYDAKRANHKLEEIAEVANEGSMPIKSYQWMHGDSKLTPGEVEAITSWVKSLGITLEKN